MPLGLIDLGRAAGSGEDLPICSTESAATPAMISFVGLVVVLGGLVPGPGLRFGERKEIPWRRDRGEGCGRSGLVAVTVTVTVVIRPDGGKCFN